MKKRIDFQKERNRQIYKDLKSKKYRMWELAAKYQLSTARLHQIRNTIEADIIINSHSK